MKGRGIMRGIFALAVAIVSTAGANFSADSFFPHTYSIGRITDLQIGRLGESATPSILATGGTNVFVVTAHQGAPLQLDISTLPFSLNVFCAVTADLDGDRRNDLIVATATGLTIFRSSVSPEGPFELPRTIPVGTGGAVLKIVAADLDNDGRPDLACSSGSAIYFFRNESSVGNIVLTAQTNYATTATFFRCVDVDGDGKSDLALSESGQFPYNSPVGNRLVLNTSKVGSISFATNSVYLDAELLVDLNGDGLLDAVHVTASSTSVFIGHGYYPGNIRFAKNKSAPGTIVFSGTTILDADFAGDLMRPEIRNAPTLAGDLDGDGRVDFALIGASTNGLTLARNTSVSWDGFPRTFASSVVPGPTAANTALIADVNGDGKPEIILGTGSGLTIFENQIQSSPELWMDIEPTNKFAALGQPLRMRAFAYHANVGAVEFLEDGVVVARTSAGLDAEYRPATLGVHSLRARAIAGNGAGLTSPAIGVRVVWSAEPFGKVIGLGKGPLSSSTALLYENGALFGVGANTKGQLADDITDPHFLSVNIAAPANAGNWMSVALGSGHMAGLTTSGRLFTWGDNSLGQLGRATARGTNSTPGEVVVGNGGAAITKVAAGSAFTLALDADGNLFAWGGNSHGQLGLGHTNDTPQPTRIVMPIRWVDVSCGNAHTLALSEDGKMFAWGIGRLGVLGTGDTNDAWSPKLVPLPEGEERWTNIAAGAAISMGQTAAGRTYAWGFNSPNALGLGDAAPTNQVFVLSPLLQPAPNGVDGFRLLAPGGQIHAALSLDGKLYVWGGAAFFGGPVGLSYTNAAPVPTFVTFPTGVTKWIDLAMLNGHGVAVGDDGKAYAWGFDFNGGLGNTLTQCNIPTAVCPPGVSCTTNFPPIVQITGPAAGDFYPLESVPQLQISAADMDGFVDHINVFQNYVDISGGFFAFGTTNLGRLEFGERALPLTNLVQNGGSIYVVAYDQLGQFKTSSIANVKLLAPSTNTVNFARLYTNEFTGALEISLSFRNFSSFTLEAVTALITNIPPELKLRNVTMNGPDSARAVHNYTLAPNATVSFRFEYTLPDDVTNAVAQVQFVPVHAQSVSFGGDVQPVTESLLSNRAIGLEFDHAPGDQHTILFSDDLTTWLPAPVWFKDSDLKIRWVDNGPPATTRPSNFLPHRFYRVLRGH